MSNLVSVKGVSKSFGDKRALEKVDLEVPAGCVVGLVGVNGAGKTTLICTLMGSIVPDEGEIELFGESLSRSSTDEVSKKCRSRIGFVLDANPFPSELSLASVGDIMGFAYEEWDAGEFKRLCDSFGLNLASAVKGLSRGMSMKLQLACALSHHAELLILDEATAGLDPIARDEILDILSDFMREGNRSILLSSHITTDLEKVADIIVGIDGGKVFFQIEKDEITDEMGLAHCTRSDCEKLLASNVFGPQELWTLDRGMSVDVMVPDRRELQREFPAIACDRLSIDEYLQMRMKGELR